MLSNLNGSGICRDDIAILFLAFVFPWSQNKQSKCDRSPLGQENGTPAKKAVAHSDESTGAMQNPFGEKLN